MCIKTKIVCLTNKTVVIKLRNKDLYVWWMDWSVKWDEYLMNGLKDQWSWVNSDCLNKICLVSSKFAYFDGFKLFSICFRFIMISMNLSVSNYYNAVFAIARYSVDKSLSGHWRDCVRPQSKQGTTPRAHNMEILGIVSGSDHHKHFS